MKLLKMIAFVPVILNCIILTIVGIMTLLNGEIPIYGETNDPSSTFPTYLHSIINLALLILVYLLLVSPLLLIITFITNEFGEKRKVIFYLFIYVLGLITFILIRNTMFFAWLLD